MTTYPTSIAFARLLLILTMLTVAACLPAQSGGDYDLTWNSLDAGGLILYGGDYEMAGTVGQPETLLLSGGDYALSGGFLQDGNSFPLPVALSGFSLE